MENWEMLYEVLIKRFKKKPVWSIDAMKLAEMIKLTEPYPSLVVRKVESAINKINKKNGFNISLAIHRPRNGKASLTFSKTDGMQKNK